MESQFRGPVAQHGHSSILCDVLKSKLLAGCVHLERVTDKFHFHPKGNEKRTEITRSPVQIRSGPHLNQF
jgi:hypothetical protein